MSLGGQTADWKFHLQSMPGERHSYSSNEFCVLCFATKTLPADNEAALVWSSAARGGAGFLVRA